MWGVQASTAAAGSTCLLSGITPCVTANSSAVAGQSFEEGGLLRRVVSPQSSDIHFQVSELHSNRPAEDRLWLTDFVLCDTGQLFKQSSVASDIPLLRFCGPKPF
jgi:hypothetical protein